MLHAVNTVSRDRHIKSLRFYDDFAGSTPSNASDTGEEDVYATALATKVANSASIVLERCKLISKRIHESSSLTPTLVPAAEETCAKMILAALERTKRLASTVAKADDELDTLLRNASPSKDAQRERLSFLDDLVRSLDTLSEALCNTEKVLDDVASSPRRGFGQQPSKTQATYPLPSPSGGLNEVKERIDKDNTNPAETVDHSSDDDEGETLGEIAEVTGVSVSMLQTLNPDLARFHVNDVIPPGTRIRLPSVAATDERGQMSVAVAAAVAAAATEKKYRSAAETTGNEADYSSVYSRDNDESTDDGGGKGETLSDVAHKTNVPLETLIALNPEVVALFDPVRSVIPVGTPVRIPEAAAKLLASSATPSLRSAVSSKPRSSAKRDRNARSATGGDQQSTSRRHRTSSAMTQSNTPRESLRDVAEATGVTIDELQLANPAFSNVDPDAPLPANTKILVPAFTSSSSSSSSSSSIARDVDDDQMATSPKPLRSTAVPPLLGSVNNATGNSQSSSSTATTSKTSSEERGDTLSEIASLYGISVVALKNSNPHLRDVDADAILPIGTTVHIPTDVAALSGRPSTSSAPPPQEQSEMPLPSSADKGNNIDTTMTEEEDNDTAGAPPVVHVHTLASLAVELGVNEEDIRKWNPFLQHVASDQVLTPGLPIRILKTQHLSNSQSAAHNEEEEMSAQSSAKATPSVPLREERQQSEPGGQRTLKDIADEFGTTAAHVRLLNPHVKHLRDADAVPPNTSLQLPKKVNTKKTSIFNVEPEGQDGHAEEVAPSQCVSASSRPLPSGRTGAAVPSRSINDISKEYGISAYALREANPQLPDGLSDYEVLPSDVRIKIPRSAVQSADLMARRVDAAAGSSRTGTRTDDDGGDAQQSASRRGETMPHDSFVAVMSQMSHTDDEEASLVAPAEPDRAVPFQGTTPTPPNQMRSPTDPTPLPFTVAPVATPRATLAGIAAAQRVTVDALREWNPEVRQYPENLPLPRSVTVQVPSQAVQPPPPKGSEPRESRRQEVDDEEYDEAEDMNEPRGETLASISQRYHIPVSVLREHNPSVAMLDKNEVIPSSTALKLPLTPAQRQLQSRRDVETGNAQPGGANRSAAIAAGSRSGNLPSSSSGVKAVADSPTSPKRDAGTRHGTSNSSSRTYKCSNRGETLASVARKHHTTVPALRKVNSAFESCDGSVVLPPGVVLTLPAEIGAGGRSATRRGSGGEPSSGAYGSPDEGGPVTTGDDERIGGGTSDEEPRETTPRELYSESHQIEERMILSQEELMTPPGSPDRSATFLETERRENNTSATVSPKPQQHRNIFAIAEEPEERTSSGAALANSLPSTRSGRNAVNDTQREEAPVSSDQDPEPDEHQPLERIAMIRAGGETIRALCQRYNISEPSIRLINPELQPYHFTKQLPIDMLLRVPAMSPKRPRGSTPSDAPAHVTLSTSSRNSSAPPPAHLAGLRPVEAPQARQDLNSHVDAVTPAAVAKRVPSVSSPPRSASRNIGKTFEADGLATVQDICIKCFVREDVLRSWNPVLRRYHSKTVVPMGTTIFLEPPPPLPLPSSSSLQPPQQRSNDELPTYITVPSTTAPWTLRSLANQHHISDVMMRKLNPQLSTTPMDAPLPEGTLVCVEAPAMILRRHAIAPEVLKTIEILSRNNSKLILQRFFVNWKLFTTVLGSKKHVADAELRDERDQLQSAVAVNRLTEMDLRRRVTELRMVVDSLKQTSPLRTSSPVRDNMALRAIEKGSNVAAAHIASQNISPIRRNSPSRPPVVADVGGLPWLSQPERVASVSPARTVSPHSMASLRSAPSLAAQIRHMSSSHPDGSQDVPRGISPNRGKKPSLGLTLNGLRVTEVSGSAAKAGIQPNDAILRVDGKLVSNASTFRDAVSRAPGPRVCITVQHATGGSTAFMLPLYPINNDSPRSLQHLHAVRSSAQPRLR